VRASVGRGRWDAAVAASGCGVGPAEGKGLERAPRRGPGADARAKCGVS